MHREQVFSSRNSGPGSAYAQTLAAVKAKSPCGLGKLPYFTICTWHGLGLEKEVTQFISTHGLAMKLENLGGSVGRLEVVCIHFEASLMRNLATTLPFSILKQIVQPLSTIFRRKLANISSYDLTRKGFSA